jgi:paraquat-inducible protein A
MALPAVSTICRFCGQPQIFPDVEIGQLVRCYRCRSPLARRKPNSLSRSLAFATAALLLYFPANLFPIMSFEYYGAQTHNTVWSGVVSLAEGGMWFVASIVFLASIAVPLMKIVSIFFLSFSIYGDWSPRWRTRLYRVLRVIGSWAMLDVFLLAVLVAAVKLGQLATVVPGPGALPFTLVVILTILATESFDPQLLWDHERTTADSAH